MLWVILSVDLEDGKIPTRLNYMDGIKWSLPPNISSF